MQRFLGLQSSAARTIVLACAAFFAAGLLIAAIGPSLPTLATRLGVDVAALGGLFSSFSVGVMLAQLVVVRLSSALGQRHALALSIVVMGAGGAAIALVGNVLAVLAAALLCGAGFGGILATGNTLIARLFARRSAAALNGINLFFGVGSITGPSLAALAPLRPGAPQAVLVGGAALLLLLAPCVALFAAAGTGTPTLTAPHAKLGRSWMFGLLLLLYTGIEISLGAWLTLYMLSSATSNAAHATLVAAGFWFALTTGRGLAAVFGLRLSGQRLLAICLAGLILGTVLLAASVGAFLPTVAAVLILGLSCGPVFPTTIALLSTADPSGVAVGRALLLGNGGGLVVPAMLGVLLTRVGPLAASALLTTLAVLLALLGTYILRTPAAGVRQPPDFVPTGDGAK